MKFTQTAIVQATRDISKATGKRVRYDHGARVWQWEKSGNWVDVPPANAAAFDDILQQVQAALSSPQSSPQSPAPVTRPLDTNTYTSTQGAPDTVVPVQNPHTSTSRGGQNGGWVRNGRFVPKGTPGAVWRDFGASPRPAAQQTPSVMPGPSLQIGRYVPGSAGISGLTSALAPLGTIGRASLGAVGGIVTATTGAIRSTASLGAVRLAGAASNVYATGNNIGDAAQAVANGGASVISNGFNAGVAVADAIAQGLLSQLGPSGQALQDFTSTAARLIGSALNDALQAGTQMVGKAGRVVGTVGGVAAGAVGALGGIGAGMMLGPIGMLAGGTLGMVVGTFVGMLASKLISAVSEIVGSVLSAAGKALGAAGELVASGLRGIFTVVRDLMETADRWGAKVATISAQIGATPGQAAGISSRFNALGLGGQLDSLTGDIANQPWIYGMRSRAFGLGNYTGRDFLPSLAGRFQELQGQGPMGQLRARMMTNVLGFDSPESLRVLSINPQRLRDQQQEVGNFARDLGLDPERLKEAADGVYLFQNKVQSLVEILKLKVLDTAISYLGPRIERLTEYITQHADAIGSFVEKALSWFFESLPPMVLRFAGAVSTGFGNFLVSIGSFLEGLQSALPSLVEVLNGWLRSGHEFVANLVGIGAAISQVVQNAFKWAQGKGLIPGGAPTGATGSAAPTVGTVGTTVTNAPAGATAATATVTGANPANQPVDWLDAMRNSGAKQSRYIQGGLGSWVSERVSNAWESLRGENTGFAGRAVAVPIGAISYGLAGAASAKGGGRAALYTGLVAAAAGAAQGYDIGQQWDAGGASRARVIFQVAGGVKAATASKMISGITPLGRATAFTGGYLASGKIYDALGNKLEETGVAGVGRALLGGAQTIGQAGTAAWTGQGVGNVGAVDAFNQAKAAYAAKAPWQIPDRFGAKDGPIGSRIGAAAEFTTNAGKALIERGAQLEGAASNTEKLLTELRNEMRSVNRNTARGADETQGLRQGLPGWVNAVSARTAQIVNDEAMANLSWSG